MKYSLTLNQKAVYDCGLEKDIDFIDLAILSVIKHIIGMSKIQTTSSEGKTYYWISYSHISSELPILGIKKDGIYRRIKKYIDIGLMSANPLNSGGRTYFHITELFDLLFSDTYKKIDNTTTDENPNLRMKTRTPTDENPNPLNIIEHNTNNNNTIEKEKNKKEQDFENFWKQYPNKTAKEECMKKFKSLCAADVAKIFETLPTFLAYKPFATYTHPNPLTYLNQKRWNDEIKGFVKPIQNEQRTLVTQQQPNLNEW